MTKVAMPRSFRGSLVARKSNRGGNLPKGTYVVKVQSVTPETPEHNYETFLDMDDLDANGNPKVKKIADDIEQDMVLMIIEGVGVCYTHLSTVGNVKFKDITPDQIPEDYDFSKTAYADLDEAQEAAEEDWDSVKSELFFDSASGYAVRRDNHWRVTDAVIDENGELARDEEGNHLSGPQTATACEISEDALFNMGYEGGEYTTVVGNYVKVQVSYKNSKLTGKERMNVRFLDQATEDEYTQKRGLLI